ncbi:hypothetical protein [Cohnella faecalis]|uniref:Uncharacterized protein n=1 Tax=Cohnella faecalis TaxID=2315694 RepID=A0A398CLT0_9BACL|nr:hypothetical protein [Cohnella faecalis]RIE00601.1 hypothetical protein D3H35_27465 [Cohnella faecalis]
MLVSFKLRIVHQEERKHIKLVYDRSEATQRTYAPQSFIGLLVADLEKGKHFVEVDLDDPFFRVFTVSAERPLTSGGSACIRRTCRSITEIRPIRPR